MRRLSFRYRMFIYYSLLLVSALIMTVLISQKSVSGVFRNQIVQNYQREMIYITNSLQTKIDHLKDYQMTVALNKKIQSVMKAHAVYPENIAEANSMRWELVSQMNTIIGTKPDIYQWMLVTQDNTFICENSEISQKSLEEILEKDYFEKNNSTRSKVLRGPFLMNSIGNKENPVRVFVLSKQIVEIETLRPLGYTAFLIKDSSFTSVFENNVSPELKVEYFLLSEDDHILASSDNEKIGLEFAQIEALTREEAGELGEQKICEIRRMGKEVLYTMVSMKENNWKVVYSVPMDTLLESQHHVVKQVRIIGLITCLFSLIFLGWISRKVTKPIISLTRQMYTAYFNKPAELALVKGDEIQNLYLGFDSMMRDSRQLMQQIREEQAEKSRYHLQLIQAQIKPHFLYNTLETIKSLVDCGWNEQASEAIMAVARFYRMSLNEGNDIVSVANELELSRQYFYIQKLRYMDYLNYEIVEAKDIGKYLMPKMTLQPILENAIYHGIKIKQENGKIRLTVQDKGTYLLFLIEDNGAGIEAEKLKTMNEQLKEGRPEQQSFGLYSVNRRIQLFFGTEYGISIESRFMEFTRVKMRIPKKEQETVIDRAEREQERNYVDGIDHG